MIGLELFQERKCSTCTPGNKIEWGCDTDAVIPQIIDGQEEWRCPRRPILEQPAEFGYYLKLYRQYRLGVLPESGAMMEQAEYIMRVFDILDVVYAEVDEQLNPKKQ